MHAARKSLLITVAVLALAATGASAQDFQRIQPNQLPPKPPTGIPLLDKPVEDATVNNSEVVKPLKGIVFVPSAKDFNKAGHVAAGIDVSEVPELAGADFQALMTPYLGRTLTVDDLRNIRKEVSLYLRDHDRPLSDVIIPPQTLKGGTMQVAVILFTAGKVAVTGNKHFDTDVLMDLISTRTGEVIKGSDIIGDVDTLKANPFRDAKVTYSRSDTVGATDVTYDVPDQAPWRVFAGYQNNGTQSTDRNRLNTGVEWGDAFGIGDDLSYQFTTSPDVHQFWAHSFTYKAPVNTHDQFTLLGAYANTQPVLGNSFGQTAVSYQLSGRYEIPVFDYPQIDQHFSFGFDFKHSDSNLTFSGLSVLTSATDIEQFAAGYSAVRPDSWGETSLAAWAFYSPGGLTGDNNDVAFQPTATTSGRPFATAQYLYANLELDRVTKLPQDFSLVTHFIGQYSGNNLLASEQLGLGGATSVRGYEERAVNTDSGILFSNEIRLPSFPLLGTVDGFDTKDNLQFLAFWDYGIGILRFASPGEKKTTYLSSLGVGARYNVRNNLSLTADWGQALIPVPFFGKGSRIDVSLTFSY